MEAGIILECANEMGALRHRASLLQVTQQGNHKSLSRRHVNVKHDQIGGIKRRISLLVAALSLLMMFAHAARADPKQSDQPAAAQIDADQDPEYDGLDITRPQNRFDLRSQDRTFGTTNQVTQETEMLRFSQRFDLSSMWRLGTVTQLPLIARQTAASDSSAPVSEFGIGDVFVEPTLVRKLDPQWSIVFGARFFVPTASDSLGTGKWQVMPIMAARYEWADNSFFAPLARYAVSVAGDPSRRDISTLELQPLLNIGLSRNWFVVLYPSPDIRLNYGDPISGQTGRLFLPADVLVGIRLNQNCVVGLELSTPIIREFPVYNFKTELRLQVTF